MAWMDTCETGEEALRRAAAVRERRKRGWERSYNAAPSPIAAKPLAKVSEEIPIPARTIGGAPVKSDAVVIAEFAKQVREIEPALYFPATPQIRRIVHEVASHFGVPVNDILSQRRTAVVVFPRQVAMYLAKTLTLKSLPEVGRRFGGRDHTTVLHAVRKIAALIEKDEHVAAAIAHLKVRLGYSS